MTDHQVAGDGNQHKPTIFLVSHINDDWKKNKLEDWISWLDIPSRSVTIQEGSDQINWGQTIGDSTDGIVLVLLSKSLHTWWSQQGGEAKMKDLIDRDPSKLCRCPVIIEEGIEYGQFGDLAKRQGFTIIDDDIDYSIIGGDAAEEERFRSLILRALAVRSGIINESKKATTIFISYSTEHKSDQEEILRRMGKLRFLQAWVDEADIGIGEDWKTRIEEKIPSCDFFVSLLSRDYFKSQWCAKELVAAWKANKDIVLLRCKEDFTADNINSDFRECFQDSMLDVTHGVNYEPYSSLLSIDARKLDQAIVQMLCRQHPNPKPPSQEVLKATEEVLKAPDNPILFNQEYYGGEEAKARVEQEIADAAIISTIAIDRLKRKRVVYRPLIPVIGPGIHPEFYIRLDNAIKEIAYANINNKLMNQSKAAEQAPDVDKPAASKEFCEFNYEEEFIGSPCLTCPMLVSNRPSSTQAESPHKGDACPMIKMFYKSVGRLGYDADDLIMHQDCLTAIGRIESFGEKHVPDGNIDQVYIDILDKVEVPKEHKTSFGREGALEDMLRQILSIRYPIDINSVNCRACPVIITTRYDNLVEELMKKILEDKKFDILYFNPPPIAGLLNPSESDRGCFKYIEDVDISTTTKRGVDVSGSHFLEFIESSFRRKPLLIQLFGRLEDRFVITKDQCNALLRATEPLVYTPGSGSGRTERDPVLGDISSALNLSGYKYFLLLGYDPNDPTLPYALKSLWDLSCIPTRDQISNFQGSLISCSEPPRRISRALENAYGFKALGVPRMNDFLERVTEGAKKIIEELGQET